MGYCTAVCNVALRLLVRLQYGCFQVREYGDRCQIGLYIFRTSDAHRVGRDFETERFLVGREFITESFRVGQVLTRRDLDISSRRDFESERFQLGEVSTRRDLDATVE